MNRRPTLAVLALLATLGPVAGAEAAQTPPLVNPLTVAIGATVHITPVDQGGNVIPVGECTLSLSGVATPALSNTVATFAYDATGANLTGVAAGSGNLLWHCVAPGGGGASVDSPNFTVTVPWNVTAVGDTSP